MDGDAYAAHLASLDWFGLFIYIAGLLAIGLITSRRSAQPEEYFLASRDTQWPAIGLALFASNMSSTALVGLAGAAYAFGIAVYDYEWSAAPVIVFFCVFLIPFILRSRVYTMPEYLERRYDVRARLYFLALSLFLTIFVDASAFLYTSALVGQKVFPHTSLAVIAIVLAGAAGIYTLAGGLRAVIWVQAIQAIVLMCGATMISITAFGRVGGWHAVMTGIDKNFLSLIRPMNDTGVPWPGLLTGIPVLGFYFWCTSQFMVQRVLSARNIDHARRGVLFAAILKLPVLFLMVFPGICAILLFPHLPRADLVYPTLLVTLLPAGLTGIVVASFFAAAMVSLASTLHSASTLIAMDLGRILFPQAAAKNLVLIGRIATACILVFVITWVPQMAQFPSLWQYLQGVLAYAVPSIVALFLIGLFWRGANATGASATMTVGTVASVGSFFANEVFHWIHLHFLYVAPLLFLFDCIVLVGVSLWARQPEKAETESLVWTPRYFAEEGHGTNLGRPWQNYRLISVVLLALTAILVVRFR